MDEPSIKTERHQGYWEIVLNRPHRLNAFTEDMHKALRDALGRVQSDESCRALLLTGAGRGFCSGQDLNDRLSKSGETTVLGDALDAYYNPLIRTLRELPLPVVAAVNGIAAGAGCNIALACDIVLAARSATFVQSFAKIGLVPDCGGSWILPRLIGPARARALALTGAPVSAETAEHWGMIWRTVVDDDLLPEAHRLCQHFATAPTQGLALIKQLLDRSWSNDLNAQLDLEKALQREASMTPDYTEGVRAFLEKRTPKFSGNKRS